MEFKYKGEFFRMLEHMLVRPQMHVGEVSLDRIRLFLSGFVSGYDYCGHKDPEIEHYKLFDEFVQKELGETTTIGWPNLIAKKARVKSNSFRCSRNY